MTNHLIKLTLVKLPLGVFALGFFVIALPVEQRPDRLITAETFCPIPQVLAVVGRPLRPVSYAGVAQRTSRRKARRVVRR